MLFLLAVPKTKTDVEIVGYFWTAPIIDATGSMAYPDTLIAAVAPLKMK